MRINPVPRHVTDEFTGSAQSRPRPRADRASARSAAVFMRIKRPSNFANGRTRRRILFPGRRLSKANIATPLPLSSALKTRTVRLATILASTIHAETMITIYHNPRCSKSRETLALIETLNTTGAPVNVVEYLKTPPTVDELETLHRQLGRPVRDMLRDGEEPYKTLDLGRAELTDAEAYAAIAAHPILLQRPIVVYRGKAAIGRPPEAVRALFE